MTEDTTGQRLPVLAALTATVLWSAGNVLVKASTLPGPQLAFWRTFCGASIYSTVFIARGGRLRLSAFRSSWAGGLGFGLQASLYFTALRMTSLTSAAVIASTNTPA